VTLRFLLDTSIVSAGAAKEPPERVIRRLRQDGAACAIAAPVWHELVYGVARIPAGKRRDVLDDYLRSVVERSFPILAYDELAAAWHGRERARLDGLGKTPPFVDGQIAAIAYTNGLTLVTANPRDFAAFRGLRVVDWAR
jgi:tRNA(fMet)-specific endonuclease VapC